MTRHEVIVEVLGPWSLAMSKQFWEGFAPGALPSQGEQQEMRTVFRVEGDWSRAEVRVTQQDDAARIVVEGDGDLGRAVAQTCRFLSLDVDGRGWAQVAERDAVIADAQEQLPGLRPCGFHSPYEAAAWSVLSQRIRIVQAAKLRDELVREHGQDGAFPAPERLRSLDLELPGRKTEYLHAVAEAALDGRLDGDTLRAMDVDDAVSAVQEVKGLGPFAAELVVLRGANAPDAIPHNERRLDEEITFRYGADRTLAEVSENWRPFRTWAAVHLRSLREARTHEIGG
ncbi:MAG: DNA-3-methyladenine glycosylase [Kribbellaceae bacterium]|jgi:DNA-3-methyladenine glycosylase II|nr:DNA-3-methyladenine glycosylase [Kribbellaceae bacterium]